MGSSCEGMTKILVASGDLAGFSAAMVMGI